MIDQINLFTGDASIQYSITLNIILLAAIVILTLIFYLIARKRKYERPGKGEAIRHATKVRSRTS